MVDVEGPFTAVGDELIQDAHGSILMAFPLAAGRTRILIPVRSAQQVGATVSFHIECGDAFGVICAQTVREESQLRDVAGGVAGSGLARAFDGGKAEERSGYRENERAC